MEPHVMAALAILVAIIIPLAVGYVKRGQNQATHGARLDALEASDGEARNTHKEIFSRLDQEARDNAAIKADVSWIKGYLKKNGHGSH